MLRDVGMDRQGMYNLLSSLDDREIALFEKGIKETVYDKQIRYGIRGKLVSHGIADGVLTDGFRVKYESGKIYEYEIKGSEFDEDRRKNSWIIRCYVWCEDMCRMFSKEFLLKLVNQKDGMNIDEKELLKRLKMLDSSIVEHKDYIITSYFDEIDKDIAEMDMEKKLDESAYVPTTEEIEEFYRRGFLFSKPSYQKLYDFLVKELGDEEKAYEYVDGVWGEFQVFAEPEELVLDLDDRICSDPQKKQKVINLLKKAERETNIGHYSGNTIVTAIENGLDLKVDYIVPLYEESIRVRGKKKGRTLKKRT